MVKHKKVYTTFFNLDISDHILCTMCGQVAVCRSCHDKAESSSSYNKSVRLVHLSKVLNFLKYS